MPNPHPVGGLGVATTAERAQVAHRAATPGRHSLRARISAADASSFALLSGLQSRATQPAASEHGEEFGWAGG